jgi:ribonuclease BN (tRNA processing enzyme)
MCSGYLVQVGADYLVFDHGFGAHHRLLELGVAATQVTHAFFSHHHYDHIGDLAPPAHALGSGCRTSAELEVYGPPGMEAIPATPNRR